MKKFLKKYKRVFFLITLLICLFGSLKLYNYSFSKKDYSYEDKTTFLENQKRIFPSFNNDDIKELVDSIIDKDLSKLYGSITYEIKDLKEGLINIFFKIDNNGKYDYRNYLIDLSTREVVDISRVIKNTDEFNSIVNTNIINKYPYFIFELITNNQGNTSYLFKENELLIYYTNLIENYENEIFIKLNYNEIKDYLDFTFLLDDVYENDNLFAIDNNKKSIALTFDDGPSKTITPKMLDLLKKNHASATFFVQGYRLKGASEVVNSVFNSPNEIGNHTYSHKQLNKISDSEIVNQIEKTNATLSSITGSTTSLVRPPYGNVNSKVLENVNYPMILWSIDSKDWSTHDVDKIVDNVINNVCDGCVILFHDVYTRSAEAIEKLLPKLYTMGYQVMSVSKLVELKGITLENNKTYRYIR